MDYFFNYVLDIPCLHIFQVACHSVFQSRDLCKVSAAPECLMGEYGLCDAFGISGCPYIREEADNLLVVPERIFRAVRPCAGIDTVFPFSPVESDKCSQGEGQAFRKFSFCVHIIKKRKASLLRRLYSFAGILEIFEISTSSLLKIGQRI